MLNRYEEHLYELKQRLVFDTNSEKNEGSVQYTSEQQDRLDELSEEYESNLTEIELNETSQKEINIKYNTNTSTTNTNSNTNSTVGVEKVSKEILLAILPSNLTQKHTNTTNNNGTTNNTSPINKVELYTLQEMFMTRLNTMVSTDIRNKSDLDMYLNTFNNYMTKLMVGYVELILKQVESNHENGVLKVTIECVENEKESLQCTIHKLRVDHTRKVDQLKCEHEDKQSYLLKQLRIMEMEMQEMHGQMGQMGQSSGSGSGSGIGSGIGSGLGLESIHSAYPVQYSHPYSVGDGLEGRDGHNYNGQDGGDHTYTNPNPNTNPKYTEKQWADQQSRDQYQDDGGYNGDDGDDDQLEDSLGTGMGSGMGSGLVAHNTRHDGHNGHNGNNSNHNHTHTHTDRWKC